MWKQSECPNKLNATKRSKSLEKCTFESKEQNSIKNVLSFSILSALCGRPVNRKTDKGYLEAVPGTRYKRDFDDVASIDPNHTQQGANGQLKYVPKRQQGPLLLDGPFGRRTNISISSNYYPLVHQHNPESEFATVRRGTPTLSEFVVDHDYRNLSIYLGKAKVAHLQNARYQKLSKRHQSDDREFRFSQRSTVKRGAISLDNQIRAGSIKQYILGAETRNYCASPSANNLFSLIDDVARHESLEIGAADKLPGNGSSNRSPFSTNATNLINIADDEKSASEDHESGESCEELDINNSCIRSGLIPKKDRAQLKRQAEIQSRLSSHDSNSDRYGTALEDLAASTSSIVSESEKVQEENLTQSITSLNSLSASAVRLVMSLSYRSQPLNNFTKSEKNLGLQSTTAPRESSQENQARQYVRNDEIGSARTKEQASKQFTAAILEPGNNNQSLSGYNNNTNNRTFNHLDNNNSQLNSYIFNEMVGTQNTNNVQLSTANAILDASTFTGDMLPSASIEMQLGKTTTSPAMLTLTMPQNPSGSANQMNPNSLSSHRSCTEVPFYSSSYGSSAIFQDRKLPLKPPTHEISNFISDHPRVHVSAIDGCGVSKSIQGTAMYAIFIFYTY